MYKKDQTRKCVGLSDGGFHQGFSNKTVSAKIAGLKKWILKPKRNWDRKQHLEVIRISKIIGKQCCFCSKGEDSVIRYHTLSEDRQSIVGKFEAIQKEAYTKRNKSAFYMNLLQRSIRQIEHTRNSDVLVLASNLTKRSMMLRKDAFRMGKLFDSFQKESDTLDVILTSCGGELNAAMLLAERLNSEYRKINFLIPFQATSSATLLSLIGDEIVMNEHSVMSLFDPQFDDIPAAIHIRHEKNPKKRYFYKKSLHVARQFAVTLLLRNMERPSSLFNKNSFLTGVKRMVRFKSKYLRAQKIARYMTNVNLHGVHDMPLTGTVMKDILPNVTIAGEGIKEIFSEHHFLSDEFLRVSGANNLILFKNGFELE